MRSCAVVCVTVEYANAETMRVLPVVVTPPRVATWLERVRLFEVAALTKLPRLWNS